MILWYGNNRAGYIKDEPFSLSSEILDIHKQLKREMEDKSKPDFGKKAEYVYKVQVVLK